MNKKKVLFLCSGNSCRSQMAEAIVNAQMGDEWEAVSAGTYPEDEISQYAIKVLGEIGIRIQGKPKHPDIFRSEKLDLVVTICDNAAKECPVWLGEGNCVHMPFEDPAKARGSEEEILQVYRESLGVIRTEIPKLLDKQNLI